MREDGVLFTRRGAQKIARATELVLARALNDFSPQLRPPLGLRSGGVPVYNSGGSTIPAYGVMKPASMSSGVISVGKPDTSLVPCYLLNGPKEITASGKGRSLDFGSVKIDSIAAATAQGWGPTPDSFDLTQGNPMSLYVLGDDGTNTLGLWGLITTLIGQADDDIAANSSGTVTIWASSSSATFDSSTSFTVTAFNDSAGAVTAGVNLQLKLINGLWNIDYESCGSS